MTDTELQRARELVAALEDEDCRCDRCATRVAIRQLLAHVDTLTAERDALLVRRDELLATVARIANETPFPDEIRGWTEQRAKLIAEVGSLKAERDEARRERDAFRDEVRNMRTIAASAPPTLTADERDLVVEVCHDLTNRAMRHEADMAEDAGYIRDTDDRRKEAAIRKLLEVRHG